MANNLKFNSNSLFSGILFAFISVYLIISPSIALGARSSYLIESDLQNVDRDMETNKSEHKRNNKQLIKAEKYLKDLPNQIETAEGNLKTRVLGLVEAKDALDRARQDYLENPNFSISSIERKHEKAKNDLQDSKDELERMNARLAAATRKVPEKKNEISRLETESENLAERKSELEKELEDAKEEEETRRRAAEPWAPSGYSVFAVFSSGSIEDDERIDDTDTTDDIDPPRIPCQDCKGTIVGAVLVFPSGVAISIYKQDIGISQFNDSIPSSTTYNGTANLLGVSDYFETKYIPRISIGYAGSFNAEGTGISSDDNGIRNLSVHSTTSIFGSFAFFVWERGIISLRWQSLSIYIDSREYSSIHWGLGFGLRL